jgi:hypothetical protein
VNGQQGYDRGYECDNRYWGAQDKNQNDWD